MPKICHGPIYQSTMLKSHCFSDFSSGVLVFEIVQSPRLLQASEIRVAIWEVGWQRWICPLGKSRLAGVVQSCQTIFRSGAMSHQVPSHGSSPTRNKWLSHPLACQQATYGAVRGGSTDFWKVRCCKRQGLAMSMQVCKPIPCLVVLPRKWISLRALIVLYIPAFGKYVQKRHSYRHIFNLGYVAEEKVQQLPSIQYVSLQVPAYTRSSLGRSFAI